MARSAINSEIRLGASETALDYRNSSLAGKPPGKKQQEGNWFIALRL
jgi:hypothetical protein